VRKLINNPLVATIILALVAYAGYMEFSPMINNNSHVTNMIAKIKNTSAERPVIVGKKDIKFNSEAGMDLFEISPTVNNKPIRPFDLTSTIIRADSSKNMVIISGKAATLGEDFYGYNIYEIGENYCKLRPINGGAGITLYVGNRR